MGSHSICQLFIHYTLMYSLIPISSLKKAKEIKLAIEKKKKEKNIKQYLSLRGVEKIITQFFSDSTC
jgi:hypothetical protein